MSPDEILGLIAGAAQIVIPLMNGAPPYPISSPVPPPGYYSAPYYAPRRNSVSHRLPPWAPWRINSACCPPVIGLPNGGYPVYPNPPPLPPLGPRNGHGYYGNGNGYLPPQATLPPPPPSVVAPSKPRLVEPTIAQAPIPQPPVAAIPSPPVQQDTLPVQPLDPIETREQMRARLFDEMKKYCQQWADDSACGPRAPPKNKGR